jgi:preprotein translocase subunit SecE
MVVVFAFLAAIFFLLADQVLSRVVQFVVGTGG